MEAVVASLERDAGALEVDGRLVQREPARQLPGMVIEAGQVGLDELERVRLVAATEQSTALRSLRLGQAEMETPAGNRLVEVCHS